MVNLVGASLDFWLTAGRCAHQLERRLARYVGVEHCLLVNSGSSANLLAFATLCSHRLGDRRIVPGDEVIALAASFPTLSLPSSSTGGTGPGRHRPPHRQYRRHPAGGCPKPKDPGRDDRPHARQPFDVDAVKSFCRAHDLWLVEDNCDALGSIWRPGDGREARTGSFGHLSTSSFYPAHHMTTGEGGAVYTSDPLLASIAESIRDWGRDCYCASGKSNTCGERFCRQMGTSPTVMTTSTPIRISATT